jgi:hypothetical protein
MPAISKEFDLEELLPQIPLDFLYLYPYEFQQASLLKGNNPGDSDPGFPPLFTFLFMATLAASFCLLVIFPDSRALSPYSPKAIVEPLRPCLSYGPRITFLCLTLFLALHKNSPFLSHIIWFFF